MKHIFLTIVLCISTLGWAQNQIPLQRTVSVYGTATAESESNLYKSEVTLSLDNSYYAENPCTTIDELQAKYFTELKKVKVDVTKFEEDELAYAGMGYRKDGKILRFITNDKEEMMRMASCRMPQVNASYIQMKTEISQKEIANLLEKAMQNAKDNANALAKVANAKLGTVVSISSYNYNYDTYWKSLNSKPEEVRVTVVFELVD